MFSQEMDDFVCVKCGVVVTGPYLQPSCCPRADHHLFIRFSRMTGTDLAPRKVVDELLA